MLKISLITTLFWFSLGLAMELGSMPIQIVIATGILGTVLTSLQLFSRSGLSPWTGKSRRVNDESRNEILFRLSGHDFIQADDDAEVMAMTRRQGELSESPMFKKPRSISFRYISRPFERQAIDDLKDLKLLLADLGVARGSRLILTQFKSRSESMVALADVCEGFAPLSSAICENIELRTDLIPVGELHGRRLPKWVLDALDRDYEEVIVYAPESKLVHWRASLEPVMVAENARLITPATKAEEEYSSKPYSANSLNENSF